MHLGVFVKGQDRPDWSSSYVNNTKMGKTNISGWSVVLLIFHSEKFLLCVANVHCSAFSWVSETIQLAFRQQRLLWQSGLVWFSWGSAGLRGRAGHSRLWLQLTVMLGLIKRIPSTDGRGCGAPGPALLPAGQVFSRHCTTCWSDLGQRMFQLGCIPSQKAWLLI